MLITKLLGTYVSFILLTFPWFGMSTFNRFPKLVNFIIFAIWWVYLSSNLFVYQLDIPADDWFVWVLSVQSSCFIFLSFLLGDLLPFLYHLLHYFVLNLLLLHYFCSDYALLHQVWIYLSYLIQNGLSLVLFLNSILLSLGCSFIYDLHLLFLVLLLFLEDLSWVLLQFEYELKLFFIVLGLMNDIRFPSRLYRSGLQWWSWFFFLQCALLAQTGFISLISIMILVPLQLFPHLYTWYLWSFPSNVNGTDGSWLLFLRCSFNFLSWGKLIW